jgi:hypothetical protein
MGNYNYLPGIQQSAGGKAGRRLLGQCVPYFLRHISCRARCQSLYHAACNIIYSFHFRSFRAPPGLCYLLPAALLFARVRASRPPRLHAWRVLHLRSEPEVGSRESGTTLANSSYKTQMIKSYYSTVHEPIIVHEPLLYMATEVYAS